MPHRLVSTVVSNIAERRAGRHLLLLCDFDGTLVPFHPDPAAVVLDAEVQEALCALARTPGITVGIISGRRLSDLRPRVSLPAPTFLAGSHGLEIEGPGECFRHAEAQNSVEVLRRILDEMRPRIARLPGVFIEDKAISIVLHYRAAPADAAAAARSGFIDVSRADVDAGRLRLLAGADVLELLPGLAWDKGDALKWIRERVARAHGPVLTVYIGDDRTDEHAFRVLDRDGMAIAASDRVSGADFSLDGPADVRRLLLSLVPRR